MNKIFLIKLISLIISIILIVYGFSLIEYNSEMFPYKNISTGIPLLLSADVVVSVIIILGLYPLYAKIIPYGYRRYGIVILSVFLSVVLYKFINFVLEMIHHTKHFLITNWSAIAIISIGVVLGFVIYKSIYKEPLRCI